MKCDKAISLISPGIDSPVSTYLMKKHIDNIVAVHCTSEPLETSRSKELVIRMCRLLKIKRLYVTDHGSIQKRIAKDCKAPYVCILCKRFMVRVADEIAKKEGACAIITGENLGQVASQTLDNLVIITNATKLPILRPILCNDKLETTNIAQEIGTYEIGLESPPCCTFVPDQPATKAAIRSIEAEEARLHVDSMVEEAITGAEMIDLDG